MRIESVVDTETLALAEGESHGFTALADHFAVAFALLGRDAVLARQVFDNVLAHWRHLWIQLERLEVQLSLHFAAESGKGLLERVQPDRAPGTGNVGDEIDLHGAQVYRKCISHRDATNFFLGGALSQREPLESRSGNSRVGDNPSGFIDLLFTPA